MQTRRRNIFTTIQTEGSILPSDLLQRIADGDRELAGLDPEDYHLPKGEKLNEAISRSWNRLLGGWSAFQSALLKISAQDAATAVTRERWLLPLFSELNYGRLVSAKAIELDGKSYPISHHWYNIPIHLVGCRIDLDKRTRGVAGAARASPHSLVQEVLNLSESQLWGFVSNGFLLRILRDNVSLTRQAYVEFDVKGMMEGEVYADFALLWLLCHQSRVEAERADQCWLEKWSRTAQQQGTRALDQLRKGVEDAISDLGSGFLAHSGNGVLRDKLKAGTLDTQDYYRQLLRLVYRLLFLFVAEDRDLLLDPTADAVARERYKRFYATSRLRHLAQQRRGTRHADLFCGLRVVMEKLGKDEGCPSLGLPPLGSFLWSSRATPDLDQCDIANHDLLDAIRALAFTTHENVRRPIDYKNLGSEELGSVYESLLELHPVLNTDAGTFKLETAAGHERKATGSYYTPTSLVNCLLDSALDPVLDESARKPNPQEAVLSLKICDPACGSGHFLIAAAHRVAKHVATIRTGDEEPSPEATRAGLRDVIGHCIYGVDVNEMAVELCKVSLWMEALEPGRPLSFLEHRIQCGNSLLGTTPALLAAGIPNDAFQAIEGDDKSVVTALRKQNKQEREGQRTMFAQFVAESLSTYGEVAEQVVSLDKIEDASIDAIHEKEELYRQITSSPEYRNSKRVADAWCSAFVWKKVKDAPEPVTYQMYCLLQENPDHLRSSTLTEIDRLVTQYKFFHWHLAFPSVFRVPTDGEMPENEQTGWSGGFDVMLGNPPWDKIQPEEVKFFSAIRPDIANANTAALRKELIESLDEDDPSVATAWHKYKRAIDASSHLIRNGKILPLTSEGNLNTYRLFAELAYYLISPHGRAGMLVQTGMATDESGKEFFSDVLSKGQLVRFLDFENRSGFFPDVDSRFRFALVTLCGTRVARSDRSGEFGWLLHEIAELQVPERLIHLTSEDVALFNPSSGTCPVFQSERDLNINRKIYLAGRHIFINEERRFGEIDFLGELFNMTRDSYLFEAEPDGEREYVPLYEAKCIQQFDHRYASQAGADFSDVTIQSKKNPDYCMVPRSWVLKPEVDRRAARRGINTRWMFGFRDVASATNERTAIFSALPYSAVGNNINLVLGLSALEALLLCANANSYVFDFACRQKMSGMHVNIWIMKQLPAIPLAAYEQPVAGSPRALRNWITSRALELIYTAWDLRLYAENLGYSGPPFRWDEERRFLLRSELDALYFQLYGIDHNDVDYIMGTFPIVRRKDEERFGEYRTKRVILEIYDAMQNAIESGVSYQTVLDPPPADPRVAHPPREVTVPVRTVILPFRHTEPTEEEKYRTCVPLYTLRAAAGNFSDPQAIEPDGWVEIPTNRQLRPGMFVAQVVGHSMEPRIPDGAYCLFSSPVEGSREGRIVLVQHRDIHDPETGGTYTVKRYHSGKIEDPDGTWRHPAIELRPVNPDYKPIVLPPETDETEVRVIAEFVEVVSTASQ